MIAPESLGLLLTPNALHPEQVHSIVEAVGTLIVPSDFVPLPENEDDDTRVGAGAVVVAVTVFAGGAAVVDT